MEPGETIEETVRREVREETSLEMLDLVLWRIFSGPELFKVYPNGDQVYVVSAVYECVVWTGSPRATNDESLELRWFDLDALPNQLESVSAVILRAYASMGIR